LRILIKPYGVVYIMRNLIDTKVYIGQTVNLERRKNEHKNRKSSSSKRYNFHITKVIEEYGYENFEFKVLDEAFSKKDLDDKEKYFISLFKSNDPKYGYNSRGGNLQEPLNQRTKDLMSSSHIGLTETAITKRKKSHKILAFKDNVCLIVDSGKLFGDMIGKDRNNVTNALRKGIKIKGYYVFYLSSKKREEVIKKSDDWAYCELSRLIGNGVEAIEQSYVIDYITYD